MGFLTNFGIGLLGTMNQNFQQGMQRRQDLIDARMSNLYREKERYEIKREKGREERIKAEAALAQLQGMYPDMNLTIQDAYSFQKSGQLNDIMDGKTKLKGVKGPTNPQEIAQQTQAALGGGQQQEEGMRDPREALRFALTGRDSRGVDQEASSRFQASVGMSDEEMQMMRAGYASELDLPTGRTYEMERTASGWGSASERDRQRYVELTEKAQNGQLTTAEKTELDYLQLKTLKVINGPDNITSVMTPQTLGGTGMSVAPGGGGGGGGFASPRQPHPFTPGTPTAQSDPSTLTPAQQARSAAQGAQVPTEVMEDPDPYLNPVNRQPDNSVLNKAGTWALNRSTPQKIDGDIRESMTGAHGALRSIDILYENLDKAGWFKNGEFTAQALKTMIGDWTDTDASASIWKAAEDDMRTAIQGLIKGTPSNYDAALFEKTVPNMHNPPTRNLQLMKEFLYEANTIVRNNIDYMHQQRMQVDPDYYDLADKLASKVMLLDGDITEVKLQQEMKAQEEAAPAAEEAPATEPAADIPSFNSPSDPGFEDLPVGSEFMYKGEVYRKQ